MFLKKQFLRKPWRTLTEREQIYVYVGKVGGFHSPVKWLKGNLRRLVL